MTTNQSKTAAREHPFRWMGLAIGLAVSGIDIAAADALGITFSISGSDATALVWVYLAFSFGALGYLIGWLVESRRRERRATRGLREQMDAVSQLQLRLTEREKLAALGQLAATIAHEVRNPLAIMRSTLQNISEEIADSRPAIAEQHSFLLEEIDRLSRVLSTVLDYARPMRLHTESMSASELVDRVELLSRALLAPKELSLERRADDIALSVDADLICQALLGLLANGIEATPRGGSVTLEVCGASDGVELSVADRGPGVPEDKREAIFEPFFTTKSTGSGLGLAVAKRIVEAHDGAISVKSRDGGGARFIMRLPLGHGSLGAGSAAKGSLAAPVVAL